MSSVFTLDQRYLAWNFFMLHLINDMDFTQLNNDPTSMYPEWADLYAERVIRSMSDILKSATQEAVSPAKIEIPSSPPPPMPANNGELYQGLLMIAPQLNDMPSSPSSISSESSFSDFDSPSLNVSSASEESSVPTFSKVIARPRPIQVNRPPSSGYVSPTSSSSCSSVASSSVPSDDSAYHARPRLQRKRRVFQRRQPQAEENFMCSFCRKNAEPKEVYTSHNTKDSQGHVTCPILSAYTCEACGATGPDAHTRSHCPLASVIRQCFSDDSNVQIRYSNYAQTARNSN